jgi:hypothetical protein
MPGGAPKNKGTHMEISELVGSIGAHHRLRRYWMKVQQKLDRALEAYVRVNCTGWREAKNEKDRKREADRALAIIKAAKDGEGELDLVVLVETTIAARAPADRERKTREAAMTKLAEQLPVFPWVDSVAGFGALGFATIVALTGDLSNYANVAKVWKRLMLAPYAGHAGSTWKRETWRPRALTKDEWIANPFSGERYALIAMIADSLHKKQIQSKAKSKTQFGRALGPYGKAYVDRREHTARTHSDWTLMHAHRDALRVMVKSLVKDLWTEWAKANSDAAGHIICADKAREIMPAASEPSSIRAA